MITEGGRGVVRVIFFPDLNSTSPVWEAAIT